jgi:hypothetical protein
MSMKNKAKHFTSAAALHILELCLRFKVESSRTVGKELSCSATLFINAVVLRIFHNEQAIAVIFTTQQGWLIPCKALFFRRFTACKLWHEDCLIFSCC